MVGDEGRCPFGAVGGDGDACDGCCCREEVGCAEHDAGHVCAHGRSGNVDPLGIVAAVCFDMVGEVFDIHAIGVDIPHASGRLPCCGCCEEPTPSPCFIPPAAVCDYSGPVASVVVEEENEGF